LSFRSINANMKEEIIPAQATIQTTLEIESILDPDLRQDD